VVTLWGTTIEKEIAMGDPKEAKSHDIAKLEEDTRHDDVKMEEDTRHDNVKSEQDRAAAKSK
jgi:hypothetical protein